MVNWEQEGGATQGRPRQGGQEYALDEYVCRLERQWRDVVPAVGAVIAEQGRGKKKADQRHCWVSRRGSF